MGQAPCAPSIHEDILSYIDQKLKNCIESQNEALIKELVKENSALNLLDTIFPDGNGVLHLAVQQQNINLIRYLLSNGLSANKKNPRNGDTPLHIASRLRNAEIVSLLTKCDGDRTIANYKDETPLSITANILKDYNAMVGALSIQPSMETVDEYTEFEAIEMGIGDEFSREEVARHSCLEEGIWIIIGGIVYDITVFIQSKAHPATNAFIESYYGSDATEAFDATFHSLEAVRLLKTYEIGRVKDDEIGARRRAASIHRSRRNSLRGYQSSVGSFRRRIRVSRIFLFPVKGMKGIEVQKAELTLSGFVDDRIYAVVNKATKKAINQLTYPRLAQITVAFPDGSDNCDDGIRLNDKFVPFVKDKSMSVSWKSCSTKILVYDQGEAISKWITAFLNQNGNGNEEDEFILVRIHEDNSRQTEEFFQLSFAPKETQKMSAFQNYAPVLLASEESMSELNRRYRERDLAAEDEKEIDWDRFRKNVVVTGVLMAHFEDFMKHITFGDLLQGGKRAEILWSRRRYFCAVPQVNQGTAVTTAEPLATARSYRNAITLNDRTSLPGDDAVFFGSLYCVKHSGMVRVGQAVISEHEKVEYDTVRDAFGKSYFGLTEENIGSQFEINYLAQYEEFELVSRSEYNHDSILMRFAMIIKSHHVFRKSLKESLHMGDHYLLKFVDNETPIIRAYTPIFDDIDNNDNDNEMSFDVLVKVYPNGRMSQHLNAMKIGDTILCKKSYGKACYFEIGRIRFGDPRLTMFAPYSLNVNQFNLIAAGSGITPMYQIITNIHLNQEFDKTQISLIYANKSEKDILLRDKLEEIDRTNENIKIHFIIEEAANSGSESRFDIGRTDLEICKKYLFPPTTPVNADRNLHVVTLLCGPYPMQQHVKKCLTKIGYEEKAIATF